MAEIVAKDFDPAGFVVMKRPADISAATALDSLEMRMDNLEAE
jgi:hypothetical protein